MNRKFGKIIGDGQLEYAPDVLVLDGHTILGPKAVHYEKAGYVEVQANRMPSEDAGEGKHWERTGKWLMWEPWDIADNAYIYPEYKAVDNPPPPPRVFSKMKCVAALMKANVWDTVKGWIENAGLYDLYLAAQDFKEDNEYFVQGRTQLQEVLGWSDEQIEAVLATCIADGW